MILHHHLVGGGHPRQNQSSFAMHQFGGRRVLEKLSSWEPHPDVGILFAYSNPGTIRLPKPFPLGRERDLLESAETFAQRASSSLLCPRRTGA